MEISLIGLLECFIANSNKKVRAKCDCNTADKPANQNAACIYYPERETGRESGCALHIICGNYNFDCDSFSSRVHDAAAGGPYV